MKNLIALGIKLRVTQDICDNIIEDIEGIKIDMDTHITEMINEIINEIKNDDKNKKNIDSYLEEEIIGMSDWWCAKQMLILDITKAYQYSEGGLALPNNKEILAFLLPKITEKTNITFVEMGKEKLYRMLEEWNKPTHEEENWVYYKITTEEK